MIAVSRKRKGGSKRFHSKKQWRRQMGLREQEELGTPSCQENSRPEEGAVSQAPHTEP
ncbi:hypothetical protein SEA_LITTLEFELLA_7 [Gordonia phage LittleFella]|nr:hypothetical protein SEA_LITTLEFELLA_7 [Gordonia phage LittleFella]